jgi:hypothetical protein
VSFYEPGPSAGGYNLILYRRRVPALIDMNGALVHSWPAVRASARAQLQPDGRLAVITDEGGFAEYDWEGRLTTSFTPVRRRFLHHDLTRLRNGDYLLLVHALGAPGFDYLLEIDRSGRRVWRWESSDHLAEDLETARPPARQPHMNSVQELPPNVWFDRGHREFRPGNILVSARHLNTLYIIARPGGNIVWRHTRGLDYQHEARMVPPGFPSAGHILVFDNGYNNFERFRRSAILELDPISHSVVWQYDAPHFFSSTAGTEQALPGGNVLVTSSESGRAFEVTRKGRIVWQWTPPYPPMRVARYAYDYCPQLAARKRPEEKPVRRADPDAFIDAELYRFALDNEVERVGQRVLDEKKRRRLFETVVDADRFQEEVARGPIALRHRTLSLAAFGEKRVELCLTLVDEAGTSSSPGFLWMPPSISAATSTPAEGLEEPTTEGAARLREEQLKALGYVE